jgi:hypothetical protein
VQVEKLYRLVYGRSPTNEEFQLAHEFLGHVLGSSAWERYAQALLVANELVFID